MTSALQSMDQGIIKFLEHKYRRCLVCKFQERLTTTEECYRMLLFDAISMLAASWNAVIWETNANCYQKAGFYET
jgi:hypothetical protein